MFRCVILIATMILFLTSAFAEALLCYQCFGCSQATQIECDDEAVAAMNKATNNIFYEISTEKGEKFDCMTLAYLTDDSHAKMQGCVYTSQYACSLKPRNYSVVYICGTCDSDFCNSSTSITNARIMFTLFATMFTVTVARIL